MGAFLGALKAKAVGVGIGALLGLVFVWATKMIPQLLAKYADKYLDKILDQNDPRDRELVLALVKWAEYKIPDKGQGTKKYELVAAKLVKLFPLMSRYEVHLKNVIENAVEALDQELKDKK